MKKFIYDLLYTLPLSIISAYFCGQFLGESNKNLIYVLAMCMMTAITAQKHLNMRNRIYLSGAIFAFIMIRILMVDKDDRKTFLIKNRFLVVFFLLLILVYILGLFVKENVIVRKGVFILLAALTGYFIFRGIKIENIVRLALFAYFVTVFIEEIQSSWKKSGYNSKCDHMVGAVPFILTLCIAVGFLPSSDNPYDWSICRNMWDRLVFAANEFSCHWYRTDEYDGVGFSDMCELGGDVSNDHKPKDVLELTGSRVGNDVVYLSGIIFDSFDGKKWSVSDSETEYSRIFDVIETRAAVRSFDPEYVNDYMCLSKVDMSYRLHNTKYVFAPSKAILPENAIEGKDLFETKDKITTKKALRYGDKYSLSYVCLNRENSIFDGFMNSGMTIDSDSWENERKILYVDDDNECSFDKLSGYHEYIKNVYGQKPSISDELRSELDKIYDGACSDYEKMQRLEAYLKQYKYTYSPGDIPDEIDNPSEFLDYFLLQKKEGYCVYYATAFALIARAEGLPSRYVQGYRVENTRGKIVNVTARSAHAWPEVYFEGKGWISFEPTPGFFSGQKWNVSSRGMEGNGTAQISEEPENIIEASVNDEDEEINADNSWDVRGISLAFISGIAFLVLYILLARIVVLCRNKKYSVHEQTLYICRHNLKLLRVLKIKQEQGETLEEFAERIKASDDNIDVSFIECYEKIIYGNRTSDEKMLSEVMRSQDNIIRVIRRKKKVYGFIRAYLT